MNRLYELMDTSIPWEWLDEPDWAGWREFLNNSDEGEIEVTLAAIPQAPIEIKQDLTLMDVILPYIEYYAEQYSFEGSQDIGDMLYRAGTLSKNIQLRYGNVFDWRHSTPEELQEVLDIKISHASFMINIDTGVVKEKEYDDGDTYIGSASHVYFETNLYNRNEHGELRIIMSTTERIDAGGFIMQLLPTVVNVTNTALKKMQELSPGHPQVVMYSGKGAKRQKLYDALGRRLSKDTPYNYIGAQKWKDVHDMLVNVQDRYLVNRVVSQYTRSGTPAKEYYLLHNSLELQ